MRILVCIASYGSRNDQYLHQLIEQYATMPHAVHVVVVSNIQKELPKGVELKVGLPIRNPWSLPFAHRPIFTERKDDYDLFIYSEDDTLITDRHISAFMEAMKVLREDEVAGFLRSEEGPDGARYYSTIHRHFHWDPESVVHRGEDTFAFFSNEHGACYILTREQLRRAIASGGFSVPPHAGKYDMLVSAATDPYTQCGFKKMVCISRLEDFTCKHLTNKYLGRTGLEKALVDIQINALLEIGCGARPMAQPTRVETRLPGTRWTKSYYEPQRDDLLGLIPAGATRILSLGCGWGKTEEALIARGADVTAIPLDVVIGAVAANKGIRTVPTTLAEGPQQFVAGSFDAILIAGLLHLIDDPVNLLRAYGVSLAPDGVLVVSCPNVAHLAVRIKRFSGDPELKALGDYRHSGVHFTSAGLIRNWLAAAGFAVQHAQAKFAERWKNYNRLTLSLLEGLWAEEYAFVAKKCPLQEHS